MEASGGRERQLRIEEVSLRNQNIQVIRETSPVSEIGKTQGHPQRIDLSFLGGGLFKSCADTG